MMPDLPNVGWERDVESFREYFENPAFRSDGLKVYPTLVIRGTGLYELWRKGLYKNYHPDKARSVGIAVLQCWVCGVAVLGVQVSDLAVSSKHCYKNNTSTKQCDNTAAPKAHTTMAIMRVDTCNWGFWPPSALWLSLSLDTLRIMF